MTRPQAPGPRPKTRRAIAHLELSQVQLMVPAHGPGAGGGGLSLKPAWNAEGDPVSARTEGLSAATLGLGRLRKGAGVLFLPGLQDSLSDPEDVLDRERCLETLAALRHAKWFQVRSWVARNGDGGQPPSVPESH